MGNHGTLNNAEALNLENKENNIQGQARRSIVNSESEETAEERCTAEERYTVRKCP